MNPTSVSVNDGFDRLQRLLLAMHVGDELRPNDAAEQTGLSPDVCREVLLGLERAGLMARDAANERDRFVRQRLNLGV
jgi:DNA-binding IclR family transcriptional regulator